MDMKMHHEGVIDAEGGENNHKVVDKCLMWPKRKFN